MTETERIKSSIKKRLNSYNDLARERRQIENQLAVIEARLTPGGQVLDGMPRAPGGGADLSGIVAERLDLEERYRANLRDLIHALESIEDTIAGLEPVERMLARFRYIEGHTWEEVCVDMSYSWRQVHRIHAQILNKLTAAELENIKERTTNKCD